MMIYVASVCYKIILITVFCETVFIDSVRIEEIACEENWISFRTFKASF